MKKTSVIQIKYQELFYKLLYIIQDTSDSSYYFMLPLSQCNISFKSQILFQRGKQGFWINHENKALFNPKVSYHMQSGLVHMTAYNRLKSGKEKEVHFIKDLPKTPFLEYSYKPLRVPILSIIIPPNIKFLERVKTDKDYYYGYELSEANLSKPFCLDIYIKSIQSQVLPKEFDFIGEKIYGFNTQFMTKGRELPPTTDKSDTVQEVTVQLASKQDPYFISLKKF